MMVNIINDEYLCRNVRITEQKKEENSYQLLLPP